MASSNSLVGTTIAGRYRIASIVGKGSMATVYRASQEGDPPDVAVKVMHSAITHERQFVRRFQREAATATLLDHPNTVRILEYGIDSGRVFIAMEFVDGRDLAELLEQEKRLSQIRAVEIMIEVCDALAAAHAQSVVHRDLSPENIMLYWDPHNPTAERIKVVDFGLAKLLDEEDVKSRVDVSESSATQSALTSFGALVGKPEYIAPEQVRSEPVDGRTDLYACGVMLYQMITGQAPFTGGTPLEIIVRHAREVPRRPSERVADLHPRLEAIILKALAKEPLERQQSALALRDALRDVLGELLRGPAPRFSRDDPREGGSLPFDDTEDEATLSFMPASARAQKEDPFASTPQAASGSAGEGVGLVSATTIPAPPLAPSCENAGIPLDGRPGSIPRPPASYGSASLRAAEAQGAASEPYPDRAPSSAATLPVLSSIAGPASMHWHAEARAVVLGLVIGLGVVAFAVLVMAMR